MDSTYDFLKDYLDLSLKKNSRKGATHWALTGAIAAIAWYFLKNIHTSDVLNVWRIASFLAPCALLISFFVEVSRWGTSNKNKGYKILRLGATAGINRQQSLSIAVYWGVVLVSYCYFFKEVGFIPLIGSAFFPFLFFVAGLINFKENIGREFAVQGAEINSRAIVIFLILFVLASVACLYFVFRESSSFFTSVSRIEWQLGLAIVVCAWLASQLINDGKDELKFKAIESIWIEYCIGEIGTDEAKSRLRQLIHGARIDELLGVYIAKYQVAYAKALAVAENIKNLNATVQSSGDSIPKELLDLSRSALPGLRNQLENEVKSCESVLDEIKRTISKYSNDAFNKDALQIHGEMLSNIATLRVLASPTT